ncbi:MAG: ParB/RepB/Spo0J family partition protein [Treponema sp.]|nr:ParB/RepB/Spo0J family partition protein [Treponema sp.]
MGDAERQTEDEQAHIEYEPPVDEIESAPKAFAKRGGAKNANLPDSIETDDNGTLWIDPDLLKPNPHQPRQIFDESQLKELSDSIAEHGIVQPIVIEDAGDGSFYIIAGERRTRAAKLAGLKKVPVQLRKFNDEKKLEVALIENIQRADLNPIEEAQAYYNLMKIGGLNQDEVAQKVGKGRPTVANALRLLKLPEDMQNSLIVGQITSGHARALLSVVNPADQRVLFGKIIGSNLSVRQAEAQAAAFNDGGRATKKDGKKDGARVRDPDIISIEQKFMETLGTKVSLNGSLEKGQLVIDYFSRADLDRLYQAIIKE